LCATLLSFFGTFLLALHLILMLLVGNHHHYLRE
jgi:hypothetical protein